MKLDIYSDDHLAYVTMSEGDVARTVELTKHILVDFDEFNMVVGVEFLDLDAKIPFDQLVTECHVDSAVVEELRQIQPTINGFIASVTKSMTEAKAATKASKPLLVSA
jgi:uncharacterized protein YuzE